MIDIDYSNGKIKITTENLESIFLKEQLPLKFCIKKSVSKDIVWSTDLHSNMWAVYGDNEMNDVVIYDNIGNFISQYNWNILMHGSIFYKSLWFYCKSLINKGIKPNGLVIGTHDGEFGEWVPVVRGFMSEAVLIEGSEKQFNKLLQNYDAKYGVTTVKNIVTPNGGLVEYFEGGRGYTNTVVERVIRSWETEEISSSIKNSVGINSVIHDYFDTNNKILDWIHLDVEGLDVKLLLSLKKEYIPKFIIFEDHNLSQEDFINIEKWILDNNFVRTSQNGICMISSLISN